MQFWKTHNMPYGNVTTKFAILLALAVSAVIRVIAAEGVELPAYLKSTNDTEGITIIPTESCNLNITDHVSPTRIVVEINKNIHNHFGGWFDGLPVGQLVTVGLSMEGKGDVEKWNGLSPFLTLANPNDYAAYEWFAKNNEGRWISSDMGKLWDRGQPL